MKQKNIAIFTTTRAEYGVFFPLLKALQKNEETELMLFVGGTHLAPEHGRTVLEIEKDGIPITACFDYLLNGDIPYALAKSAAVETSELAQIFRDYDFDAICILGDRSELLPIVLTALLFRKPIIHLHGGERSEGALDEQIRHMITKSAHLHFAACDEYADNILRMGEEAFRVHNTGALAVDNMKEIEPSDRKEFFSELGLNPQLPTAILTYHPVTLESEITPEEQINNLFEALSGFNIQLMITAPNIDSEREKILEIIHKEVKKKPEYHYQTSLGMKNFHRLLRHCDFMTGNSSSGIVEAPFYKIPTVNIGIRQKGRIRHKSVIDTGYSSQKINNGIQKALDPIFKKSLQDMDYKFGDGFAAQKMVEIINSVTFDEKFLIKKLSF